MSGVIDADTHISEGEVMWGMIDKEMYHFDNPRQFYPIN